jgi:D-threo-aldose 1-dehydrogenase
LNPSEQRKLGRSPVKTTILGFGGSTIGNIDGVRVVSQTDALSAIQTAWDRGIRYFDTAPLYGAGLGEQRMGHAIRQHSRETYTISTKVGAILKPLPPDTTDKGRFTNRLPFEVVYDYSYDATLRSVEDSMQRLGLNRFDIALIHDIDAYTHGVEGQKRKFIEAMEGAYPALEKLRREGVIQAIGVGVSSWEVCQECVRSCNFDCFILAGRYTLLEQKSLETFLPLCQDRNIGVIAAAPYNSGILVYGAVDGVHYNYAPASSLILEKTRRIESVCARHGVTLAAAALQFPLGHPAVSSVLPGPRTPAQVETSVKLFKEIIPEDFWEDLKEEQLIDAETPNP